MKAYKFLFLCLFPFLVSGCGATLNPYHENFNCQAPEDSGLCVDTPSAYKEAVGITQPVNGEAADPEKRVDQVRLERLAQLLKEPQTPMVTPPRIVRVLILPYKGNGDLFMARYAYLQVEPSGWVLPAVDEGME